MRVCPCCPCPIQGVEVKKSRNSICGRIDSVNSPRSTRSKTCMTFHKCRCKHAIRRPLMRKPKSSSQVFGSCINKFSCTVISSYISLRIGHVKKYPSIFVRTRNLVCLHHNRITHFGVRICIIGRFIDCKIHIICQNARLHKLHSCSISRTTRRRIAEIGITPQNRCVSDNKLYPNVCIIRHKTCIRTCHIVIGSPRKRHTISPHIVRCEGGNQHI